MARGEYDQSSEQWRQILEIDPDHSGAREGVLNVSDAIEEKHQKELREKKEKRDRETRLRDLRARGSLSWDRGDIIESKQNWQAVFDVDPEDIEARQWLLKIQQKADIIKRVDDRLDKERHKERLLRRGLQDVSGLIERSETLRADGRYEDAMDVLSMPELKTDIPEG